jgi:hypothetical protein
MTPCRSVDSYRLSGGATCHYLLDLKRSETSLATLIDIHRIVKHLNLWNKWYYNLFVRNNLLLFFFSMAQQPLVGQGLLIIEASRSHSDTPHSVGHSGRVISPTQRPLSDNAQHLQETDIHAPGGIRTHNPSKRAAEDPLLRPHGHWDQQCVTFRALINHVHKTHSRS